MSLDLMITVMQIGELATADGPSLVIFFGTSELLSNGNPSSRNKSVALSTAEAEYYSASLGAAEVIYLRQLLRDMGFEPKSPT